jgi:ABC-type multidrug transport system ATPase subunit
MIQITNLSFSINKKQILSNFNCNIQRSKINALIGSNGSGKSTLLKLISGYWRPDTGEILIDDVLLTEENKPEILRDFGFLIEEPRLYSNLTVRQNVISRQIELGLPRDKDVFSPLLNTLSLVKYLDFKVQHLSMGSKLKVGLALTLIRNPSFLLLDEPTSSLDSNSTNDFGEALLSINQEHKTTICFTSHNLELVNKISDNIVKLG